MWDRLRLATAGGNGRGPPSGSHDSPSPSATATATATAAATAFSSPRTNYRAVAYSTAPGASHASSPHAGPSRDSWQPRSSVIAARQRRERDSLQPGLGLGLEASPNYQHFAGRPGPAPPRPPRERDAPQQPRAPEPPPDFQHQLQLQHRARTEPLPPSSHAHQRHSRRDSKGGRPPSSVYSQPSPVYAEFPHRSSNSQQPRYAADPDDDDDDVSPPSSPEPFVLGHEPNHDISPIDQDDDIRFASRPRPKMADQAVLPSQQRVASRQSSAPPSVPGPRTNIPTMRRERRQQKEAEAASSRLRPPSAVDPSTKPTGPKNGRGGLGISTMSSWRPGSPGPQSPPRSGGRAGTGGVAREREQQQQQQQQQQQPKSDTDPAATAFTSSRPGWRGASGRSAIVDPVTDNPQVAPLQVPPRSARREEASPVPSRAPADHKSTADRGVGVGVGVGVGAGGDAAMASPPTSPETQKPEAHLKQQIGGGGSAGKGPLRGGMAGMASTLRKFIPSSSQAPSRGPRSQAHDGYPSPPLSGSTFPPAAEGHATHVDDASAAKIDAPAPNHHHHHHHHHPPSSCASRPAATTEITAPAAHHRPESSSRPASPSSHSIAPSISGHSIRRKEVGTGLRASSATLGPSSSSHHQPQPSFSSSVYSRTHDEPTPSLHQRPREPYPRQSSAPTPSKDKQLPDIPGAASHSPDYVQQQPPPPSRFSITPYAASAQTSSPLPTPPKDVQPEMTIEQKNTASVLDRARPKLRGGHNKWEDPATDMEPVKISLSKAWMSTSGANSAGINAQASPPRGVRKSPPKGPRDLPLSSRPDRDNNIKMRGLLSPRSLGSDAASVLSVDKALPSAPVDGGPLAHANPSTDDRIHELQTLLTALANRRMNINRAIKQMTELMPQDNLMATTAVLRKREDEKMKIEKLNRELADIQAEEHQLGMKLHRAYKKLDKMGVHDSSTTTLWVRRATEWE